MKIAWIGTGVMGSSMLLHILHGGHDVKAYNRTKDKALGLIQQGVVVCDTIVETIRNADVVITMVGYPADVREVYDEIFRHAQADRILIDMTTSAPTLAKELYQEAQHLGMHMLDAPVSGGDSGAKNATLSIMAGGDIEIYKQMIPIFSLMGTSLNYMGDAGNGQHTKACNQIAVAGAVAAMSEALVYAMQQGLDRQAMLDAIKGGAAGSWQISNTAPRVLQEDFAPGFYIKHFIKDMHIVQAEMQDIELGMLNTVCEMYEQLARQGEENLGTQALLHYYKR